jgi:hypothetical protein
VPVLKPELPRALPLLLLSSRLYDACGVSGTYTCSADDVYDASSLASLQVYLPQQPVLRR